MQEELGSYIPECGGKRSATPLWIGICRSQSQSAVAASLCRRIPGQASLPPLLLGFTMLLMSVPFIEENDQTRARQEHLEALRELVGNVYPNKFERSQLVDPSVKIRSLQWLKNFDRFNRRSPKASDRRRKLSN